MNVRQYDNHCCGCGECVAICSQNAIEMRSNEQGFLYPHVNEKKCINCSKCSQRCSFNRVNSGRGPIGSYAFKHCDAQVRAVSRSGGMFTSLSDLILESGGAVYGCQLFDCREARHTRAITKGERDAFRGSKYIQSETQHIFKSVKNDLNNGMWVLFSGTACQVNSVKDYCKDVDCSKLLLVDIVCHGVSSPKVWNSYLDFLQETKGKKVSSVNFREKIKMGWASHNEEIIFADGERHISNVFRRLFYDHYIIRRACFACPYKNLNRVGDITLADCWGIAEHYSEFDDNKGVSLVLINSSKGQRFLEHVKGHDLMIVDIDNLMQPPLKENWDIPKDYCEFWKYYNKHFFGDVIDKYVYKKNPPSFISKVTLKLKRIVQKNK